MPQEEQSELINQFVSSFTMDEINTSILLNRINTTLHEPPTTLSKQAIKIHYINYFIEKCAKLNGMNEANTQIGINACQQMFGEPFSKEPAKDMLKAAYINYFINKCDQGKAMNEANTQIGINACTQMFGEPFGNEPAKDILKAYYISYFINKCKKGDAMDEANTQLGINSCKQMFGEAFGSNELAKTLLKSAYIKYFINKCNEGKALNEINTQIGINACTQMFGEPFGNEPAKGMLKAAYIQYFVDTFGRQVTGGEMNETNTQIGINACTQMFGEPFSSNEPAKNILGIAYTSWFKQKYIMYPVNAKILEDRYLSLFNEKIESLQVMTSPPDFGWYATNPDYGVAASGGHTTSFDKFYNWNGKTAVGAGDEPTSWFDFFRAGEDKKQLEENNKYTQEMVKGCIGALAQPSSIGWVATAAAGGYLKGGWGGAAVNTAAMVGYICRDNIIDSMYNNLTNPDNNFRSCDRDSFACNSSGQCFDAKGPCFDTSAVCKTDTSFMDSMLGRETNSGKGGDYP